MLLALCSGFLLSNAYRTAAALVAPALQAELGLSPQQLGHNLYNLIRPVLYLARAGFFIDFYYRLC